MTIREFVNGNGSVGSAIQVEWIRWLLPVAIGAGALISYAKKVPTIESRVNEHDVKFARVEAKLDNIETGVNRLLERSSRRERDYR